MMRVAAAIVFGALASLAAAQDADPPPLLSLAFSRGGPIVTGTIVELPSATEVTLRIAMQLRGTLKVPTITIPYSTKPSPRRPPMLWARVPPVIGKNVLVILDRGEPPWQALEVLDLDAGEDRWIPQIRRMLDLSAPGANARAALLEATTDPSALIRTLAFDRLLNDLCASDMPCRRDILSRLYAIARDGAAPADQRLEATRTIGLKVYDGSVPGAPLNATVLTDLFELAAGDSQPVREEAIQILSGYYFGPGLAKPAVPPLEPARRTQIRNALQAEAQRRGAFARQAADLATLLGER